eukprot:7166364-Prymnesium_polylepis.1
MIAVPPDPRGEELVRCAAPPARAASLLPVRHAPGCVCAQAARGGVWVWWVALRARPLSLCPVSVCTSVRPESAVQLYPFRLVLLNALEREREREGERSVLHSPPRL